MVHKLVIYGAGGLGREIALMIDQINAQHRQWEIIGFCDDGKLKNTTVDGLPILGNYEFLNTVDDSLAVVLAIADGTVRRKIYQNIKNKNISFPKLVHPAAILGSAFNKISDGCIITAGSILTTNVKLEPFVIVNLCSTIGHDVSIGAFSALMPGAHISGSVSIGECVLIGSGAVILQGISIGSGAKVGAGAVVTKDVDDASVVVGIPAIVR